MIYGRPCHIPRILKFVKVKYIFEIIQYDIGTKEEPYFIQVQVGEDLVIVYNCIIVGSANQAKMLYQLSIFF